MLGFGAADLDLLLATYLYPFFRVLALLTSAPLVSHRSVPRRVRIGLAVLLTLLVAPTLPPTGSVSPFSGAGVLLILQQILVGAALGFAMQVAFAAIGLAGDMIGLQMGLSFANFVDPQHSGQSPVLGMYLGLLATLIFLAIDGHLFLIQALAESFRLAPIGPEALWGNRWTGLVAWGGELFRIGLHLALPVLAAMLAVNIALGVLTRAAPQLNLFSIGFPISLIAGLAMLALLLPYLGGPIQTVLLEALQVPLR